MAEVKLYLYIIIFVLSLITSIVSIIVKYSKNVKVKNNLENVLNIMNDLIPLICEAEKFTSYNGEEKKEYVVSRIIRNLSNNNIKIDEEKINEMIEKLVSFSKEVNYKESNNVTNETKTLVKLS